MDVTAILDENGNQVFATAKALKLSTSPSNTYAKHPLEDGTVVSDNVIENQVVISVSFVLDPNDYQQVYKDIVTASKNTTKFTIQTRVNNYPNMYIESYPSEESAAIYDTIPVTIGFIEQKIGGVVIEKLSQSDVANPADSDTINRGEQLPKEDTGTTLQKIAELFG